MSEAVKALLISLLVWPGTGLVPIKQRVLAALFIVPTAIAFIYLAGHYFDRFKLLMAAINSDSLLLNLSELWQFFIAFNTPQEHFRVWLSWLLLLGLWLLSLPISYYLGRRVDQQRIPLA